MQLKSFAGRKRRLRGLLAYVLAETQPVPVTVLYIEITAAVGPITDVACDLHTLGLELRIEPVRLVNPDVCVPSASFLNDNANRSHDAGLFELRQHDTDTVSPDHTKRGRLVPEPVVRKTKFVAVVVGRRHNIIDNQVRRDAPSGTRWKWWFCH